MLEYYNLTTLQGPGMLFDSILLLKLNYHFFKLITWTFKLDRWTFEILRT